MVMNASMIVNLMDSEYDSEFDAFDEDSNGYDLVGYDSTFYCLECLSISTVNNVCK